MPTGLRRKLESMCDIQCAAMKRWVCRRSKLKTRRFLRSVDTRRGDAVVPIDDMLRKIEVALDARTRQDTLIIARTDARSGLGLDEAIRRGKAYAKAGADIIFVEAPESEEEFRRVGGEIDAWLLANVVPTGKSPEISAERLQAMGFSLAIYPTAGMTAACAALKIAYEHIRAYGTTQGAPISSITMSELHNRSDSRRSGTSNAASCAIR